ncbi:MAG TPA: hypothetical protein VI316_06740 [Candidatus Dormibacteraeota bacterium]
MVRTAARITAALAGVGAVAGGALLAMHGSSTLAAAPAATASASTSAPATTAPASPVCDDGPWRLADGISVQGRPDHLDRGDRGAIYLWHDGSGWHLRTTDVRNVNNDYAGTIALSPGARFTYVHPVMNEKDDSVYLDGDNVLHYRFDTFNGVDGFDFRVSACGGDRQHERVTFHLTRDGSDDNASRIALGDTRAHPDSATFSAIRAV